MTTEYSCGTNILCIIFDYINNNKYNISFEDIDNYYQDFIEINDYISKNQYKNKLKFISRIEGCSTSHLNCINNLIRDNNVDGLKIYQNNNLIKKEYNDDIKHSLNFFNCDNNILMFFKKNYNITK